MLTLALIWLINGLHSRPRQDDVAQDLMAATLPTTCTPGQSCLIFPIPSQPSEREDDAGTPHMPGGMVFIRNIVTLPATSVPRMMIFDDGRTINGASWEGLTGLSSVQFKMLIHIPGVMTQEHIHPQRVPVRKGGGPSARHGPIPHPDIFQGLPPIVARRDFDVGDDLPAIEHRLPRTDWPQLLTDLWNDFLHEILQYSPNPKGITAPSYLRMTALERMQASEEVYCKTNLKELFFAVQYRITTSTQWRVTFTHMWPDKGDVLVFSAQKYAKCSYYVEWKRITSELDQVNVTKLRKALFERFDRLYWVPSAKGDRLWDTRGGNGWIRCPPGNGPAVMVDIHPGREVPTFEGDLETI